MTNEELFAQALDARKRAYARYSGFAVGAALLTVDGRVFLGCNAENRSLGLTICAERVAIGQAVQAGNTAFERIAVVADSKEPVMPCGACRQVMAEFNPSLQILSGTVRGQREEISLAVLLPKSRQGILG